jgi:chromate transporter
MNELLQLFVSFFKVGIMTFGGGYAMLPMLQREVVEKHAWVTEEDVLDCYAIGQCTPGVIAVNTATFVGYRVHGVSGGCISTLGIVTPSLLIISIIALVLRNFADYAVVQHAFAGIRVAVVVLVLFAVAKLFKSGVKRTLDYVVFAVALLVTIVFGVSPVVLVLLAVALGIVLALRRKAGADA